MHPSPRPIRIWLNLCILLVAMMVMLGGATRLTESGLSIVKWNLVSGTLPPLTDTAWNVEFDAYKTSPQYKQMSRDNFVLDDFKSIFWLEYLHRLLGRITGIVFIAPLLYFIARKQLDAPIKRRMIIACLLIAAQGTVGWIMVASGLVDMPRVEPLKLALHLMLAFALFGWLLWTRWKMISPPPTEEILRGTHILFALVTLQIILGALVAGLRAGLSYNSFPLMDGQWIPADLYLLSPWWKNHLESVLTVQFQHRMGAYIVVAAVLMIVVDGWKRNAHKRLLLALLAIVSLQFALGVATLLSGVQLHLALAHQFTALLLFAVSLRLIYINSHGNSRDRKRE